MQPLNAGQKANQKEAFVFTMEDINDMCAAPDKQFAALYKKMKEVKNDAKTSALRPDGNG